MELLYDLAILLLVIYPKELKSESQKYLHMFTAALLTIAKIQKLFFKVRNPDFYVEFSVLKGTEVHIWYFYVLIIVLSSLQEINSIGENHLYV